MHKNVKSVTTDRRSLMFWGAIGSDGRKMLVKCPNTLTSSSYLDILKDNNEKVHFPGLVFQQDNACCLKTGVPYSTFWNHTVYTFPASFVQHLKIFMYA